jgi:DNA adenine methylase
VTLALCKYVGSKVDLLASSAHLFPVPDHGGKVLVPFVGGGSVAAFYASKGYKVIASDINARLVNAHIEVQRDVDLVIGSLNWIVDAWRKALEGLEGDERDVTGRGFFEGHRTALNTEAEQPGYKHSAFAAARMLFMIRAGFNGLWRENAAGECTTAYGKPEPNRDLVQADSLRAYSAAIQGVEFLCEDFAVTCGRAKPSDAVYLDSPYEGTFTGYAGGDWNASQACLPGMGRASERDRLAAMLVYLDAIGARWSNSDADCATTRRLYARWRHESVSRSGRVNSDGEGRGAVVEGLWRNWR